MEYVIKKLSHFGTLAGLKLYKQKTKILVKNMTVQDHEILVRKSGFKVEKCQISRNYITNTNSKLFQNNYLIYKQSSSFQLSQHPQGNMACIFNVYTIPPLTLLAIFSYIQQL